MLGCQAGIGWMEMLPLFHLLKARQHLALQKLFVFTSRLWLWAHGLNCSFKGSSFHSLLGNVISLPDQSEVQESSDDKAFSQSQK